MNFKKELETTKTRYCVQYDDHSRMMCSVLCSLMEHQSLVDLAIRCGNNTIHAHKCILAANSPYFREQLEKNPSIEQIVINGMDFTVVKSIVEFMYCGETNVIEDNFKYMVAASKLFQIRGIQALAADNHYETDENIQIPAPVFLSKKPKYSSTYSPVNNLSALTPQNNSEKINLSTDPAFHRRLKRKYMRSEAEKACAKEAAASRLALEALQKELATTDQISSFVIEESCTETTVENFIPHSEDTFMDNLNQLEGVPLQVVNYADLNQTILNNSAQLLNVGKPILANTILQYDNVNNPLKMQESAAEKLKQILGGDIPSNVEIMFKTSDGNFVSLTDEVLQNITRESLQYQVIDEHGRAGEVQQLTVNVKDPVENNMANQEIEEDPIAKYVNPIENITIQEESINEAKFNLIPKDMKMGEMSTDQSILEALIENEKRENELKFLAGSNLPSLQDHLDTSIQMDVQSKNLHRTKIDSLKKKPNNPRKLKPSNIQSEKNFCDQFLNTSIDLTDGCKDIYSSDIACIESIDSLPQVVGDSILNSSVDIEERDPRDGGGDTTIIKKMKFGFIDDQNADEYSPRKTRSNKQFELSTPDRILDLKFDDEPSDKYDVRSRKIPIRKRSK